MNLDRYEKIDGREALKRLVCGENIFDDIGSTYFIEAETNQLTYRLSNGETFVSLYNLTEMLPKDWYIPKPFDVRQAMLERPNEWVGAFLRDDDEWMAIGFDTEEFEVSTIQIQSVGVASPKESMLCEMLESSRYLDRCVPLEDVPKEATR